MCGIWAYRASDGHTIDVERARRLIRENERRGPHAHGWAWIARLAGDEPKTMAHRKLGPVDEPELTALAHYPGIDRAAGMLGHSRLATTGPHSQDDPGDIQPLHHGDLTLAHNGTVPHPERLTEHHRIQPATGNDSELILQLAARARKAGASVEVALAIAINTALPLSHPFAAILLADDGTMAAAHWQLPLHHIRADEGAYLSSRQLPGFTPLPSNSYEQIA